MIKVQPFLEEEEKAHILIPTNALRIGIPKCIYSVAEKRRNTSQYIYLNVNKNLFPVTLCTVVTLQASLDLTKKTRRRRRAAGAGAACCVGAGITNTS
jgi:hypothetical protein